MRHSRKPLALRRPDSSPPGADLSDDGRIRDYESRLRRLTSELSLAEARERQQIASDLHEHIGQALAYVAQKVSALRGNAVFCGMESDFSEIGTILDQAIRYTRDLTVEISPPVLYELGLPAAIDWLAERGQRRYGLQVRSQQTGQPQVVAEDIKVFIFKAVQELLANCSKHARARQVEISTTWRSNGFEVRVSDDGQGFDTGRLPGGVSPDDCFGLFSIRERMVYAGGTVQIESTPGQGTCVTLSTPYHSRMVAGSD